MASSHNCGNVYINQKGNTIFYCALCERKYNEIRNFGIHIIDKHFAPDDDSEPDDMMPYISDIISERSESNTEILNDFNFQKYEEQSQSNIDSPTKIDETGRAEDDEHDEQCGEVELTPEGILIFHCSLCNNQFEGIQGFDQHISEHYSTEILEDVEFETLWPEDGKDNTNFITSNESDANINFDCSVNETQCDDETPINAGRKNTTQPIKAQEDQKPKRPVAKWRQVFETIHCPITNEEKYKCKLCGVVIRNKSNVPHHIKRVHEKNRQYKCPECPQRYHFESELKIHFRKHTGERPFLCTECGKAFISASGLHGHRESNHKKHLRHKICPVCGKSFFTTKSLHAHRSVHSDERPFKCKVCNTGFKAKKSLNAHMKIHEDKRSYKCNICSASYNYKSILTSHMKAKHALTSETLESQDFLVSSFQNN